MAIVLITHQKKYKFSSSRGILHISAKHQGERGICKTSCSLTEKFDGLVNWLMLCNFRG